MPIEPAQHGLSLQAELPVSAREVPESQPCFRSEAELGVVIM
jgi:hypothetical protein